MKKRQYLILTLIVLMGLILAACNGADAVEVQPDQGEMPNSGDVASDPELAIEATESPDQASEDAPIATTDEAAPPPEELPDIPTVKFGSGDAWFLTTDPSEIQLAAGKVQVFKFSASW